MWAALRPFVMAPSNVYDEPFAVYPCKGSHSDMYGKVTALYTLESSKAYCLHFLLVKDPHEVSYLHYP
jgi:hypothetical protein